MARQIGAMINSIDMNIIRQIFNTLPETIAAIDLGSNSFHMLIVKHHDENFRVIDQLKESVRLGSGLDEYNQITEEAEARALECLARFGQRIKGIPENALRIVGTNTLRRAANSKEFLTKAESLLGRRIEIVSGVEEARLIYLGVSHSVPDDNGRRMVIDIGGGSTEITLGDRFEPIYIKSFEMGSGVLTHRVFTGGKISKKRIRLAKLAAEVELEPYVKHYKKLKWVDVIGASGTIKSVASVVSSMGWCSDGISNESLDKIVSELKQFENVNEIKLSGLKPERQAVFAGGVMVLKAIFDTFNIDHMHVSDGALREGVIYDLIGREQHEDTRSKTIQNWAKRYHIDVAHADVVNELALAMFAQAAKPWHIDDDECQRQLFWAANIHEIGLSISHSQSHKHGEYIIRNADLLGFSRDDQKILSVLVRTQRGSFSAELFKTLNEQWQENAKKIAIILRISILLVRSRHYENLVTPTLSVSDKQIRLTFPENFLEEHPLTSADLQKEQGVLAQGGITFEFL